MKRKKEKVVGVLSSIRQAYCVTVHSVWPSLSIQEGGHPVLCALGDEKRRGRGRKREGERGRPVTSELGIFRG